MCIIMDGIKFVKKEVGKEQIELGDTTECDFDFEVKELDELELRDSYELVAVCGVDALAWYISELDDPKEGGIHFSIDGWKQLSNIFYTEALKLLRDPHFLDCSKLKEEMKEFAFRELLNHEQCHYAVDYSSTCIDSKNKQTREDYWSNIKNIDLDYEESICNANAVIKAKKTRNISSHKTIPLYLKNFEENFQRKFYEKQPRDYREYAEFSHLKKKFHENSIKKLKVMHPNIEFNEKKFKDGLKVEARKKIKFHFHKNKKQCD